MDRFGAVFPESSSLPAKPFFIALYFNDSALQNRKLTQYAETSTSYVAWKKTVPLGIKICRVYDKWEFSESLAATTEI